MTFNERLRDYFLETFPEASLAAGGREVIIRCKFCGDSRNTSSKHLYIFIGDENKPPMYHCFKCNESGILTRDILNQLTSNTNSDVVYELDKVVKKVVDNNKFKLRDTNVYPVRWKYPFNITRDTEAKRMYLCERLGLQLSYKDLVDNKVIVDLKTMLIMNKIPYTIDGNKIDILSKYCIGFLSVNNGFVTLRNIGKGKMRYMKYNIFGVYDSTMGYYCIPSTIDIMNTPEVHLRVTEGPIDILGVFYHCCSMDRRKNIYVSANGKGYINAIKSFLETYPLCNIIIDVYPDNDVRDDYVLYQLRYLTRIDIPVYIHRNMKLNEKDFGVPNNRIDERVYKV